MYGYIYITTNLVNNKIYVGQHKATEFTNKYLGSGHMIQKAIKKYGKENFSVKLLEWCDTREMADDRERYWEKEFGLPNEEIGYNITRGGQARFFNGMSHDEESRAKMSERARKRPHPPTTKGRISFTDGTRNVVVKPEDANIYENLEGWRRGRVRKPITPWNKGLTKNDDERLMQYSVNRKEAMKGGKSIGCFGVKGNTYGFVKGGTPWNKGLKGYNNGHPNYYFGKKNKIDCIEKTP